MRVLLAGALAASVIRCAVAILALIALAGPALAGTEEFSTFSVEAEEEDDESLIDHILTRTPRAWTREWEHAPQAIRSAQGCLTSEQWYNLTDLKVRTPLGRKAQFGLDLRQYDDDRARYEFMDFSFHFPTRYGTAVAMFRPFHDKSRQDFAFMWDIGSDTSAFQLRAVAGLEDLFNNFWQFRQSRVGSRIEPYIRHPYEPGLRVVVRQPRLRAELGGRWLTPSTRQILSFADPTQNRLATLWGALGWASFETSALGLEWEVRSTNQQASSTDALVSQPQLDGRDYRREWSIETTVRRRLAERLTGEAHWLYQERTQIHGPPVGPRRFEAADRVLQAEAVWRANDRFTGRVGGLYDRITVAETGLPSPAPGFGTRKESRAYLGLIARFAHVSLQGVEGIELDHESYDVSFHHDKGFLQLQATF